MLVPMLGPLAMALHYAAMSKRPDIVRRLLTLKVDNDAVSAPIKWLRKQSNPGLQRFTALQMAAMFRYGGVFDALLE